MNYTLLSRVYRMHQVKRRRIKWEKCAREQDQDNHVRDKAKMIRELKRAKRDGYRIIYIDETMFTRTTVPKQEYCLPHQNVTIDKSWVNAPTTAVLSGISREKGQELFMQFPKSVNIPKFQEYLTRLRAENGDDKICIFMDNLSTHCSKKSKKTMQDLKFRSVYCVAYSPDWNPIEFCFSKVKQKFRCLRAQMMTGVLQSSFEAIIDRAIRSLKK